MANHLTANDLMVIASDVSPGQNFLYTVTGMCFIRVLEISLGQQHSGVIGAIQALASVGLHAFFLMFIVRFRKSVRRCGLNGQLQIAD